MLENKVGSEMPSSSQTPLGQDLMHCILHLLSLCNVPWMHNNMASELHFFTELQLGAEDARFACMFGPE